MSWEYPGSGYISADNCVVMIERRQAGSTEWKHIHTTRPGEAEYTDNNLEPATRYYYRIRSRYDYGFTTDYFLLLLVNQNIQSFYLIPTSMLELFLILRYSSNGLKML